MNGNLLQLEKEKKNLMVDNCRSIFNFRTKPIHYIKGDTCCINEISEESLNNSMLINMEITRDKSRKISSKTDDVGSINGINYNQNKKFQSDNQLDEVYQNGWESKSEDERDINKIKNAAEDSSKKTRKMTEHFLPSIFNKGIICENHKEAFIFSWMKFHPFSFLSGMTKFGKNNKGILNYPSPTFIETKEWQKKPDLSKNAILYGMEVHDKEGLVLVDKDIMKKFRGIISDMIGQIIKAAFGTPISLKVQLFEPKSTLQRITDYWSFAPQYLQKAANELDPLERMKLVISFALSGLYIPTKQLKPFNPLIGETFQGEFEDGTKVYCEHISHYPTCARFQIINEDYKLHGFFDFITETAGFGSRINVIQKGPITIEFVKLNQKIIYNMPSIKLLNAKSEEGRSAIWFNTIVFADIKNNLKGIVKFALDKNYIHGFDGYIIENIYNLNKEYDHYKDVNDANDTKLDFENKKMKNKILNVISGSWLSHCSFDKVVYWNIESNIPKWIRPLTNVLPSDGRFREDLIWLYRSFNASHENEKKIFQDFAQGWKVTIEQTQRSEREIKRKIRPKKK